jgi:hypothetical protein
LIDFSSIRQGGKRRRKNRHSMAVGNYCHSAGRPFSEPSESRWKSMLSSTH